MPDDLKKTQAAPEKGAERPQPLEDDEDETVRVEANLEELPVFSATKRSRREEVVEWKRTGRDPKTGNPIEQSMTIRPAVGLGLPGQVERDLYYLVISPWIEEHGFGGGGTIGPISYREALARLGWTDAGKNYRAIREALKVLVSLNFEFRNCILDGETRQIEAYVYGHLFDKVSGIEETDLADNRLRRGEFLILAADWFAKNHRAGYVKPLELGVYRALIGSPIAQSLYNYLDKRAYSPRKKGYYKQVEEDILELKERFRLGVREMKNLLAEFRRAHEDLMKQWPVLKDARIEKVSKGRYRCVYTFDVQIDLPFDRVQTGESAPQVQPQPESKPALSELAQELVRRGITADVAVRLVETHPEELVRRQLDMHDQELRQGSGAMTNPAGRLRKRIEEDWAPPRGYETPQDRQKASEQAAERARKDAEERDRLRNWWKYETPEEKAKGHVHGPWMVRWKVDHGFAGEPSQEEQDAAYAAALERFTREAEQGRASLQS